MLSIGDPATDNLRVLAVLGDADEADQPALARLTGVEERNLAARLHDLTEAGLVRARVTKNRTWAQITREGREELRTRREALRGSRRAARPDPMGRASAPGHAPSSGTLARRTRDADGRLAP
ncbi:transcriptional regulator [Oerskovia sp. M15]